MSINSMNGLAIARSLRARRGRVPREPLFANAGGYASAASSGSLEKLTRYIPTEAITLYVALLGVIGATSASDGGRWVAFAIFAVATPAMAWIDWKIRVRHTRDGDRSLTRPLLGFNLGAATVAFAAWAFSLPASPFSQFGWYDPKWGGFVALVVSYGLTKGEALVLPIEA